MDDTDVLHLRDELAFALGAVARAEALARAVQSQMLTDALRRAGGELSDAQVMCAGLFAELEEGP